MTALTIIPDYGKKRLKLVGTVAAGEHVSVRVIGGAEWIQPGEDAEDQTLRLRVLFGGYTVAVFPRPEQPDADPSEPTDEWSEDPEDPSDAACELNLNSIPAEKLLRCGGECLCILDDPVNHTMYGAGEFHVEPWPKLRPLDEPYDLDNYPDFVKEAREAIASAQAAIEEAVDEATGVVAQAQSAKSAATDAATAATGSANTASGSANLAAGSAAAAAASASTATSAAEAAEAARDAIQPPVNPLTEEEVEDGRAADAASTGEALNAISNSVGQNATNIAKNADDIETAVGLLRSHASGATEVAGNLIHVSKQDRLNWNAKVDPAAVMQFVDGAALGTGDYKNILYLKHGDTVVAQVNMARFAIDGMVDNVEIDDGNLVITFNTEAGKQPISIPLTDIFNPANYYDKTAADARFVQKEAGKGLSTNDYTDADKAKVDNAATVAVVDSKIVGKRDKTDLKVYNGPAAWDLSVVQALYPSFTTVSVAVGYYISAAGMKYKLFISGDGSQISASEEIFDTEAAANAATQFTAEGSLGYPALAGVVIEKRATAGTDSLVPTSRTVNGEALSADVTLTGADIAVSGTDATKISAALAGKATKADATLTERKFSAWEPDYSDASTPGPVDNKIEWNGYVWIAALQRVCGMSKSDLAAYTTVTWAPGEWGSSTTHELVGTWTGDHWEPSITEYDGYPLVIFGGHDDATPAQEMTGGVAGTGSSDPNALELRIDVALTWPNSGGSGTVVATRTALQGYQLGSQTDKPLASEAEAEALRQGKLDKTDVVAPSTSASDSGKAADAKATGDALAGKLSITSTAPQFQDEETVYQPGKLVVYNGSLYVCTQQHYGPWNADHFSAQDVVDSAIGRRVGSKVDRLTVYTVNNLASIDEFGNIADSGIAKANVAVKGEIRYDRITITTGQLQDHAVQKVTLNAATTTLSLPALTDLTGKVSDFGIDIVNGYEVSGTPTAASFQLDGTLGTDYNLIVPEGEDWSEMIALAAGEMAVYYFTLSAFAINDKPTWEVMKKVVTLVPVPSAP